MKWPLRIQNFAFDDVPTLGSLEIQFSAPFTVLCGPNGAGKSTVLSALRMTLGCDQHEYSGNVRRLGGGRAAVKLIYNNTTEELAVDFGAAEIRRTGGADRTSIFANPGADVTWMLDKFCSFDELEDLLNGVGAKELASTDLELVNYVLNRNYSRVVLSEVELGKTYPFFEVSLDGQSYDSRTMGSGELASLYLWWVMERAEKGSIVLIEEPETFLSPVAQEHVGNYLVAVAGLKGLCVVITSHSAPIISPLPKECVKFIYRGNGTLRLVDQPGPSSLSQIGIATAPRCIMFVEDHAAKTFCRLLLEFKDPVLSKETLIEIRNGEGEVTRAICGVGELQGPISLLAMYDGDMRIRQSELDQNVSLFLPGAEAIEIIFRTLVQNLPQEVAKVTGVVVSRVEEVLYSIQGKNHHDWYEEICKGLGLTKDQLFHSLFVIWRQQDTNAGLIDNWYGDLLPKVANLKSGL
ncbi:MAG: AAA family ATPase [Alphaproteobacteria bacterium]|nr:AAA family ATPase [Alphaproteobacteria bacterium]MBU0834718.1 AAA family ATPase [Alphaproteobacteria bacterium]MBU1766195.1 AAA family ATPase [Alphaproteobacteria bacterium]